ncbi:MAG TPA: type II toxin-antitoxin system death-on-curing family toxin [Mucilaginibacter sp.]|jgi:death-on-curing protein|nr:type II toxin-antitoxin system death-on-curing family toxin [Mucilaginibacter sp.]
MTDSKTAIYIHDTLINEFGGSKGVRDMGALDAALNRPYATFDNIDLYPTAIDKAAAIFESIIINHPFIDGNKRTAYVLMKLILFKDGVFINANEKEKYQMVLGASKGELRFDEIKSWLQLKTQTQNQ